jgi:hypothetical protein
MATPSDCSKKQKAVVGKSFADMAVKFAKSGGKAVANAAIAAYNAALDGVKSLLNAEKTVLTPLASLDDVFIESFVKFPYNTVSGTVTSTLDLFVVPLHTIGMLGGQCSDTKKAAESVTKTMDGWRKDLDKWKRDIDKLDLIKGDVVLKDLDNAIAWLTDWKITPIP